MNSPPTPQSPAGGPEPGQQAELVWLSKISAQLADIRESVIGLLILMIVLILMVFFGLAR